MPGRVTYTLLNRPRFDLSAGLPGIFHPGQDSFNDQTGRTVSIAGSEGLTLNATLTD